MRDFFFRLIWWDELKPVKYLQYHVVYKFRKSEKLRRNLCKKGLIFLLFIMLIKRCFGGFI